MYIIIIIIIYIDTYRLLTLSMCSVVVVVVLDSSERLLNFLRL